MSCTSSRRDRGHTPTLQAGKVFWLPGRVLVVVLLWSDGVSHFFPASALRVPCLPVAFTLVLVMLLSLLFLFCFPMLCLTQGFVFL